MRSRLALLGLITLSAACGRDDRVAAELRTLTDTSAPGPDDSYDTAAVARAWQTLDSAVLAQLNAGKPLAEIQRWLTLAEGGPPDTAAQLVIPTLVARGANPVGMGNTIAVLGEGGGPDSTVAVTAGLGMIAGPSHLAVFTRRAGDWGQRYRYSSDRHLWLQGRPLPDDRGLIVGMEIFVRADGASARLVAWRVQRGMLTPLPVADTAEIEAGDFVSDSNGIAISSPQYARGLAYANPDPRVEEWWHFSVRNDTLQRVISPVNPWMSVVNKFYLAEGRGAVAESRGLVASEALRRQLADELPRAPNERGDTALGWGTVDLGTRKGYFRVLVERGPDGVWRITKAIPGREEAGRVRYPELTPDRKE